MGTPEFAVASLHVLYKNGYDIAAVITVPDKPAGRGQQVQQSPVKKYALDKNIKVLQPEKLKDEKFISELRSLNANLQVVVAFRMLPEIVWNMPEIGTFNLHGSLLPQYRGAAPINWAVMNGEKETGVSTFFLQHEIDTGKIIFRDKIQIGENETVGEVHDRLMQTGAELVLKTVQSIENNNYSQTDQKEFIAPNEVLKSAPKIFKESCKINWSNDINSIHNFIRGLSPYPAAWTELISPEGTTHNLKIFLTQKEMATHIHKTGSVISDGKTFLKIAVTAGFIGITELQLAGKKRMTTAELLRGFKISEGWSVK